MLKLKETEIKAKELSWSLAASNNSKPANKNRADENFYTAAALIAQNSFKSRPGRE